MNKFKKYCPNVWVAECEEEYQKGDMIQLTTKDGKEVECEVFKFIGYSGTKEIPKYCYSIVRTEEQSYAEKKAEKYENAAINSQRKQNEWYDKANEGREFLSLGEPIKVGHHSEKRHRALIERNLKRTENGFALNDKIEEQQRKADYWNARAEEITLAMPESVEYFKYELEKAEEIHKELKEHPEKRSHSYSLTYAKKDVNELRKKFEIAKTLWADKED